MGAEETTRRRGRPRGRTPSGERSRERLYRTAVALIAERGYEATTLRDIARRAGVSPALLYRYFPSKRAVVLEVYDELSASFAERALGMPRGRWRARFLFALETSLAVLRPHRETITALVPVLLGAGEDGLFAEKTAFSRRRVEGAFREAVLGADDAPPPRMAAPLGRLLYLLHLGVILWWLLDRSSGQTATSELLSLIGHMLPKASLALRLPFVRGWIVAGDVLFRAALLAAGRGGAGDSESTTGQRT